MYLRWQQQQITHSNNKLITTITKTSHQSQIAIAQTRCSQYKRKLSQHKRKLSQHKRKLSQHKRKLTAQTKTLTAQTKKLTAPPNRGGLSCLFLDLKKEGITWPWQVKIFAEVLDFLTRVSLHLENVWDSGEGENRVDSPCI